MCKLTLYDQYDTVKRSTAGYLRENICIPHQRAAIQAIIRGKWSSITKVIKDWKFKKVLICNKNTYCTLHMSE